MKNRPHRAVGVVFLNSAGIVGQAPGGSLQGVWQTVEVTIAGAAPDYHNPQARTVADDHHCEALQPD
jgi:hypothetical protein